MREENNKREKKSNLTIIRINNMGFLWVNDRSNISSLAEIGMLHRIEFTQW
ncbi:hypothetical protein ACFLZV_05045 [Candidatus Margulisiibacteriota bacterium]